MLTKKKRVASYDYQLLSLERAATAKGYDLDNDPRYKALCQMVTDYEWGDIRHSPKFKQDFFNLRREIGKSFGM